MAPRLPFGRAASKTSPHVLTSAHPREGVLERAFWSFQNLSRRALSTLASSMVSGGPMSSDSSALEDPSLSSGLR